MAWRPFERACCSEEDDDDDDDEGSVFIESSFCFLFFLFPIGSESVLPKGCIYSCELLLLLNKKEKR